MSLLRPAHPCVQLGKGFRFELRKSVMRSRILLRRLYKVSVILCRPSSSHDFEDLLTVIDGRSAIVEEIAEATAIRSYVAAISGSA
jgi:transcription elongation factor GreA-like protein